MHMSYGTTTPSLFLAQSSSLDMPWRWLQWRKHALHGKMTEQSSTDATPQNSCLPAMGQSHFARHQSGYTITSSYEEMSSNHPLMRTVSVVHIYMSVCMQGYCLSTGGQQGDLRDDNWIVHQFIHQLNDKLMNNHHVVAILHGMVMSIADAISMDMH